MNTDSKPETNSLFRILSSAFGCFGTGLYLFVLYVSKSPENAIFLCLSVFPLLIAFCLLLAVLLNRQCQTLYKYAEWLVQKFVELWVFTFALIIALNRLLQILSEIFSDSVVEPHNIIAKIILAFSVVFFIAYIAAIIILPASSVKAKPDYKRLQFYLSASLCYLFFPCLLVILSSLWPAQYYVEPYAYIILLVPAVIFLQFSVKNAPAERIMLTTALIITIVSIVLLGIGYALSGYPLWLWVCFGFIIIAVIMLVFGMFRLDRIDKKLGGLLS